MIIKRETKRRYQGLKETLNITPQYRGDEMKKNYYFDINMRKEVAKELLATEKVLKVIFFIWLGIVVFLAFNQEDT